MLEDKNVKRVQASQWGEFGLIEHLTKNFKIKQQSTHCGIGDDAAVLHFGEEHTVITTDLMIEGVHFDLSYMPLKHLGYKAVMVNLSDVYAMNATASQITVSIAVSNRFPVEALEALYAGIESAARNYNIDVVGGDTTSSAKGMLISITAIGHAPKEDLVYRHGAQVGDLLVVSGDLGAAYLGFQVLERERQGFKANPNAQPDLDGYSYLIERQLKPEARKDIAPLLKALEVLPTSMIDISDGLSSEIMHLCTASKVGVNVYENKIPLDPTVISTCEEFSINSTTVALSGGEDYELLFTIKQEDFSKVKANPSLSVIGHITAQKEGMHLVTRANTKIALQAQGWNAFDQEAT